MDDDFDALGLAAVLGIAAVAFVAIADILADGALDPALMALLAAVLSPLIPALVLRYGKRGKGE
jgi:hypothetical protein